MLTSSARSSSAARPTCSVPYSWVDHTAELELHVEATSPELVLQEALTALAELLGEASGPLVTHELALEARDHASLLALWLEELVYLADTQGFIPEQAQVLLRDTTLQATVRGQTGEPRPLVKAVTYHGLEFAPKDGGWRAKVVLDV